MVMDEPRDELPKPSWRFINAQDDSRIESASFQLLLETALRSKPTANHSDYLVHAAALTTSGLRIPGSNHELMKRAGYSFHAEDVVIHRAIEEAGIDDKVRAVGILAGEAGNIGTPCGFCRDVIIEYMDLETGVIITGAKTGGEAMVMPVSAYLKDDFTEVSVPKLQGMLHPHVVWKLQQVEAMSEDSYSKKGEVYAAAFVTEGTSGDLMHLAGYEGDCIYHPEFSIRNAYIMWKYGSKDPKRVNIKELVVASTGHKPYVPYCERQDLLEFADKIAAYHGNQEPIPITLLQLRADGNIERGWQTDSKECMPYPFSPASIGKEAELKRSIERILEAA